MGAPSGGEQLLKDESCHDPWGSGGSREVRRSLGQKLAWEEFGQAMNVASGQFWRDPGPWKGGRETSRPYMTQTILLSST